MKIHGLRIRVSQSERLALEKEARDSGSDLSKIIRKKLFGEDGDITELYRYYDIADELLYIGISNDTLLRDSQHSKSAIWYADVYKTKIEAFPTRESAMHAEKEAIGNEEPKYNFTHSGKTKRRLLRFRVTPEEHESYKKAAKEANMTVSDFIRTTLNNFIKMGKSLQNNDIGKVGVEYKAIEVSRKKPKPQKDAKPFVCRLKGYKP